MKKQTAILMNSTIALLGYQFENYFLMGTGIIILALVLITKTKKA